MKDKKTIKEIFDEARRAKHDSFGIANDTNMLETIQKIAEKRGDIGFAKDIEIQIEKLKCPSKNRILEILEEDHVYYSATRLSISALYSWESVEESLRNRINTKERKKPSVSQWSICRETDEIDIEDLYDADRPFTLHIPMEYFDDIEKVVDRFNFLYVLEIAGIDTSKRCESCKWFLNDMICELKHSSINKKDIGCNNYEHITGENNE